MTPRIRSAVRTGGSAALALAAAGALAACSGGGGSDGPSSTAPAASGGAGASSSAAATSSGSAEAAASGTWTETGDYQTPGGRESVTVTLTADDGTVSAVKVTGSGTSPNAQRYQAAFISGVEAAVVGKPLATLQVGAVSGSSLTGNGFNAAVDKIRTDAA